MSLRWWTATGGSFARLIPVQRPLVLEWRSRRHRRRRRPRLAPGSRRHRRRRHRRRLERHLDVLRAGRVLLDWTIRPCEKKEAFEKDIRPFSLSSHF